jgi:hypothetical protein
MDASSVSSRISYFAIIDASSTSSWISHCAVMDASSTSSWISYCAVMDASSTSSRISHCAVMDAYSISSSHYAIMDARYASVEYRMNGIKGTCALWSSPAWWEGPVYPIHKPYSALSNDNTYLILLPKIQTRRLCYEQCKEKRNSLISMEFKLFVGYITML